MYKPEFQNEAKEEYIKLFNRKSDQVKITDVFNDLNIKRTLVGIGIFFFAQFNGVNAINIYSSDLYDSVVHNKNAAKIMTNCN